VSPSSALGVVRTLLCVAAITAHPTLTARFAEDLRTQGIRVPITASPDLWSQGVALDRRVLWLHTRGERYVDAADGRRSGPPEFADTVRRPIVRIDAANNVLAIHGNI
jgi:hypothetical protein